MNLKEKKIIQSIVFFAAKSDNNSIERIKLMKLLWLSDRIHINRYGRLILKDNYNALPHGSIPSRAMDLSKITLDGYFRVIKFTIKAVSDFDDKYFSKSDLEVMDEVWGRFGDRDSFELSDFSHNFPEWIRFQKYIEDETMLSSYVENIFDFFERPFTDDFPYNEEMINNSKSLYHSHSAIQESLSE